VLKQQDMLPEIAPTFLVSGSAAAFIVSPSAMASAGAFDDPP
jgi:hypothetical protein